MRWLKSPERLTWLFIALVCASLFGVTGWHMHRARSLTLSESRVITANLARAIADHAGGVVREADIVLAGLAERLQADGTSEAALARLHRHMMARVASIRTLHLLLVFSAQGDALTTSFEPMPPINVADRAYFEFHRAHRSLAPLLGQPIQNRADGKWSLTVSRRLEKPDGTFGGVAVAVIDCNMFSAFHASFDIGAHGVITLLYGDNVLVTRHPPLPDPKLRSLPLPQDWMGQGAAGDGRLVSPLDGIARQFSFRRIGSTPLTAVVALSEDDVLTPWERGVWAAFAACSAISAVLGLLGWQLVRNIRLRDKREAALRRSEGQYRLLADFSTDVIIHLGPDCRCRYVSPASERLFGFPPEDMLDGHPRENTHPKDWPALEASLAEIFRSGHAPPVLYRSRKKDGSYVWVETQGQKLDGGCGFIVTIRDATLRREAKDRLHKANNDLTLANGNLERLARHLERARDEAERASRAKSRFLAGMSHELRTPLNGILGYAQLLRLEGGLSGAQSARVDAMLGAGQHLLQMINGVLDLSQVESERLDLHAAEIDLRSTAAACLDLVRPAAVMKGLTLGLAVVPDVPRCIMADPMRLRQILLNLLGNAVKFTACGSVELRLDQAADGTALRIEVADTGPGIPADRRARLFQEFERLGAEATGAVEGAGLGLALSARFAAVMGGRLGHEDNPGGGSVFWLELPMTAGAAEPVSAILIDPPDALPAPGRPLRLLVVDDVAMNRDIAGSFLRAVGHEVACAEGGAEAVEMAAASDFEVILMDVRMPEVDGLEATRRIRALAGSRGQVPIVALTAQAFTEQIAECRKAGMDVHLSKPFTQDALLDVVVRAIEDRTAQSKASTTPQVKVSPAETARNEGAGRASRPNAVPSTPAIGPELPVLDLAAFERTAAFLAPSAVVSYLRTLAERGEALLRGLHAPDALARAGSDLADAAHTLAGSAGMFGFERLAVVARRFERAVQTNAAETPDLAEGLCAAIEASLQEMHSRAPASAAAPELMVGT